MEGLFAHQLSSKVKEVSCYILHSTALGIAESSIQCHHFQVTLIKSGSNLLGVHLHDKINTVAFKNIGTATKYKVVTCLK